MKNVLVRSLSGSIYVALWIGAVLAGGWWLAGLLVLLTALGAGEFLNMSSGGHRQNRLLRMIDVLLCATTVAGVSLGCFVDGAWPRVLVFVGFVLIFLRFIIELYVRDSDCFSSLGATFTALIYIALPMSLIALLYYFLASPHVVLALLIFIWVNDTGAFCVGSTMGRHKLFERISPKKTWEGFFGGMLFCIGAALVMSLCFPKYFPGISVAKMIALGIVASIFATLGDLIESQFKRSAGIKDSSHLIPGHGGILDRIDSILLVMPAAFVFFILLR